MAKLLNDGSKSIDDIEELQQSDRSFVATENECNNDMVLEKFEEEEVQEGLTRQDFKSKVNGSIEKEIEIVFEDQRQKTPIRINLLVDMGVGIGGDKWPAADMFCRTLCDNVMFFESLLSQKSCIELGAGTGMVSILIEKLYSTHSGQLVVTDQESHIGLIDKNLEINECKR